MEKKNIAGKDRLKRWLSLDWDAIAGIIAAVAALVMHLLHIIEEGILLVIAVVLIALLFIRDLRRERASERMNENVEQIAHLISQINTNLAPPDAILIGPRRIKVDSENFSRRAKGEMIWFHVCLLMFKPQFLFDILLRPAIENSLVTSIQFILDSSQKEIWQKEVVPKIEKCRGKEKVKEPYWTAIDENVSLILSETSPEGKTECLLSFWGEPFMSRHAGRDVPRYVFLIQEHSELISQLLELVRRHRLST